MFLPKKLSFKTAFKLRIQNLVKKRFKIWNRESYSQLGEDIAIKHILKNDLKIDKGVYLDVGCNHPINFSNSFLLYLDGWNGITIDLNENLIALHKSERKMDISIVAAVSDVKENIQVFEFEDQLINTISKDFYNSWKDKSRLVDSSKFILTQSLSEILQLNKIKKIDLLCIDVEGHDFQVLQSIDLNLYRPKLIVIEIHNFSFENLENNEIYSYLKKNQYKMIGYLIANGYFIDEKLVNSEQF